jgi:hypothetical protein
MVKKLLFLAILLPIYTTAWAQIPDPCPSNQEPPADICQSTCIYCNFNGIMSTTAGYSGQTPPGFCGTIENEQWLGFIAGGTTATFTANATNCQDGNGIQIALYTSCTENPIACYSGCNGCGGVPAQITVTNMVPGVNYFLLIDGFAGDQCEFTISVQPPSAVQAPPVGTPSAINGPATVCPGATVTYTVPVVPGAGVYTWTGPPGSLINGQSPPVDLPAPNGNTVQITFGPNTGPAQICVQPQNSCNTGNQICRSVNVQPIPPTIIPDITVCAEDAPYFLPWGDPVNTSGNYQTTLSSYLGCDSVVRQRVVVRAPIIRTLPPTTICAGSCLTICGEEYCDGGNYSHVCTSYEGCDSTINFAILFLDPLANILGEDTLTCANDTITLTSSPSVGTKIWRNQQGGILGTGNSVNIVQPGMVILTVTAAAGGTLCTSTDTVMIPGDLAPPNVSASGGVLGCNLAAAMITASTNAPSPSYAWSGPGGFTANTPSATVNVAGNYTVTVTSGGNGCTSTATVAVTGNTDPPIVSTTGATINCNNPTVQINATSNVPNSTFSWSGPNGFISNFANPLVNAVGTYTVTVTSQVNNCTTTATAEVNIDDAPPGASAAGGIIGCNAPVVTINGSSPAGNPVYAWVGPNGFASNEQNPSVDTAGLYTLTVTGSNGCTSTATALVTGNTNLPGAAAEGGLINCAGPTRALVGSSDSLSVTYSWTGPNGFTSSQQNPLVNTPGEYTLVVTGSNLCTSVDTAIVVGDFVAPDAEATGGVISCAANATQIFGTSNTPGVNYFWTGPGGFTSNEQNPQVNTTGSYTLRVTAPNGCTSTDVAQVTPDVGVPNASADGGTLNCTVTSFTLNGGSVTPNVSFDWNGPGGFNSIEEDPMINAPGVYVLTVTNLDNGCTAQASAFVILDDAEPGATAQGSTVTCANPTRTITGSSPGNNVSWSWAGPNGFSSSSQNPSVTEPGLYDLTVTDQGNGCTSVAVAEVLEDKLHPVATASTDTLTCSRPSVVLNGNANATVTYAWTGPNNFSSSAQNPSTGQPGDYTLIVTAQNGCKDTVTTTANQDIAAPDISAAGGTVDCNNPTITITGNSVTPGVIFGWVGPNGFTSPLANPTIGLNGTYVLTVTGLNGCTSSATVAVAIDTVTAVLQGAPDDILTCATQNTTIQTTVNIPASTLQSLAWTGPGGFVSTDEDPSVTQPGTYNLVARLANGCTSQLAVTVNQNILPPNVSATGGTLTCTTTSLPLNGGSNTTGATFDWDGPNGFSSNLEDPTVDTDGTYLLTVTGPNGCTSTATTTVALDKAPPGANAVSANNLDCDDLSSVLTGSSPTGSVSYLWNGPNNFTAVTAAVTISVPGPYTVTTTGPNGCTSNATVVVSQDITPPGATATGDTTDCLSGFGTLSGNSSTSGVKWRWTGPNNFVDSVQITQASVAGLYTLTVTGPNGCTSTATASIIENNDSPVVSVSGGGTLTCTTTQLPLNAIISTPGATGVWTGPGFTDPNPNTTTTQPGVYTFTVTALNGCVSAPQLTLTQNITPPQNVSATGGLLNCSFPTINLAGSTTTTNVDYRWTGPGGFVSTQQNPAVSNPGTYILVVTNLANGCTSSDTTVVTQDPTVPDLSVTTDTITCANPSVTLSTTTTTPGVTFKWTGPNGFTSTLEDPVVSISGNYQLIATALSGCTSSFAITVPLNTTTPNVSASGLTLSCAAPNGALTGNSTTPGVSFRWTGPNNFISNQPNPIVNEIGVYTLVVTAPNGCTNQTTVNVLPDFGIPQISATGGTISCLIPSVQLTASSNPANVNWNWSGPGGLTSTLQNPIAPQPGNYVLVVTAANGCTNTTTAVVLADLDAPAIVTATPEQLNCTVKQVTLNGSVQAPGNYLYQWSTLNGTIVSGANTQTPLVSAAGVYTLTVTNTRNGCTATREVPVTVDPSTPTGAVLQVRDVACFGDKNGAVLIESVIGGEAPYEYALENGNLSSNVLYTSLEPRSYNLLIVDANGCEFETTFVVGEPEELLINLGPDTTISLGQSIELSLQNTVNFPNRVVNLIAKPTDLVYRFDCDTCAPFLPTNSFQYRITVTDANGCTAADTRLVIVDKTRNIYIPNIFNPESASENGLLMIYGGIDVEEIKSFQIYDRWGALVHEYYNFQPNYVPSAWDGKVRGDDASPGVFVYVAEILFKDGELIIYKGDVTLIRQ